MEYSYAVLFRCAEIENDIKFIKKVILDDKLVEKSISKLIIEYYQNKYIRNLSIKELQKCICANFKYDKTNSFILYRLFYEEMIRLAEINKNYKYLYEFVKDFKLNIDSKDLFV